MCDLSDRDAVRQLDSPLEHAETAHRRGAGVLDDLDEGPARPAAKLGKTLTVA
jgi:hypothetical protein